MRLIGGTRAETALLYAAAGALMIGGPVWQVLYASYYPFSRPEAIAVTLVAALIGAAVAVTSRAIGGVVGAALFGALLFVFSDLQFDLQKVMFTWLIALICVGLALVLAAHRAAITALTLGAFYAASLIREPIAPTFAHPETAHKASANAPPLLVHIVMDEQWGPAGLRAAGDTATANFMTDFYEKRGFELYDAAYSRFQYTMESIPVTLSMGQEISFNPPKQTKPYWRSLKEAPYFARLRELGYDITVFQSTYLDYCQSRVPVVACHVEYGDAIRNIAFLEGSARERARWLVIYLLNSRSHLYTKLHHDEEVWHRSVAGGGLEAARQLTKTIANRPGPGQAIFAHLLLPHRPIDMDSSCRILVGATDRIYLDFAEHSTPAEWQETLRLTAGQIRCAHRAIDRIIAAIDSTVGRDGAIVIIHGDHGSRVLPNKPPKETLASYSLETINLIFPTLLAIRRPHVPAAVHSEPVPSQDFIWALARANFAGPMPTEWNQYIRKLEREYSPGDTTRKLAPSDMIWVKH